jgi:neutral ceramidase
MATKEEYQMQGYEGGGTFFGPNQLLAFQQELGRLCDAIAGGTAVDPGTPPEDITAYTVDFNTGVAFDDKPLAVSFGSVKTQPDESYTRGDVVSAVFWGGHPRNNLMTRKTFLEVERINANGSTTVVARDWDPETKYQWKRNSVAYSHVTISWNTVHAEPGVYRLRHFGHWKSGWTGKIKAYSGETRTFIVR